MPSLFRLPPAVVLCLLCLPLVTPPAGLAAAAGRPETPLTAAPPAVRLPGEAVAQSLEPDANQQFGQVLFSFRPEAGVLLALGQRGDREALGISAPESPETSRQTPSGQPRQQTARNAGQEAGQSPPPPDDRPFFEQLMSGSALGSLFFGYPFSGLGIADILVLSLLVFTGLKALLLRRRFRDRQDSTDLSAGDLWENHKQDEDGFDRDPSEKTPPDGESYDARGRKNRDSLSSWPQTSGDRNGTGTEKQPTEKQPEDGKPRIPFKWGGPPDDAGEGRPRTTTKQQAAQMWAHLQSAPPPRAPGSVAEGADVPERFDVNEFLEGARVLYSRLQTSWAAREVDDLTPFTSPDMMRLLREQAAQAPEPEPIEIMVVNATLAGVTSERDEERAAVAFNALIRHAPDENPEETRELWHFVRSPSSGNMWRLDGIEAVDRS